MDAAFLVCGQAVSGDLIVADVSLLNTSRQKLAVPTFWFLCL